MNLFFGLGMVGPWQIIIILFVILLLFGGKKIPELMKGIGQGMTEFKKAVDKERKKKGNDKEAIDEKKEEDK